MATDTEVALIKMAAITRIQQLEARIAELEAEKRDQLNRNQQLQDDVDTAWANWETFIEPVNNYFIRQPWFFCRDKNDELPEGGALNITESVEYVLVTYHRLGWLAACMKSCIKSGEPWSESMENHYNEATQFWRENIKKVP